MEKIGQTTLRTNEQQNYDETVPYWGDDATETIDFGKRNLDALTESGSFYVQGLSGSAIGRLLNALPLPVLIIDPLLVIMFANRAWDLLVSNRHHIEGLPAYSIFFDRKFGQKMKAMMENVLATRKPVSAEGMIKIENRAIWGRIHFRSFRTPCGRSVLSILEDLTAQKKQLLFQSKVQGILKRSRDNLQKAVKERTLELSKSNEILKREVAHRKKAQGKMVEMLARMQSTLMGTVVALGSITEKRDPHTAGHQRRVAKLADAIASQLALPVDSRRGLSISAALHDIGKIYIPAEFLSRPGALSETERAIMKEHPAVGYDVLKGVDFPWPVAEIVLQHHERLDGSGYPRSLKGDEVMLEARILAVADVMEAMSSHRPYREAPGKYAGLQEIKAGAGALYDEAVVEACLSVFRDGFQFK